MCKEWKGIIMRNHNWSLYYIYLPFVVRIPVYVCILFCLKPLLWKWWLSFSFYFKQIPHFIKGIILPGLFYATALIVIPHTTHKKNMIIIIYYNINWIFWHKHQLRYTLIDYINHIRYKILPYNLTKLYSNENQT